MKFINISLVLVLNASKSTFGLITNEKESIDFPQRKLQNDTATDEMTCAVDGEKSLDCGSKEGKQSCCEGLVCHDVQYWRCVAPGTSVCAGPGTLAQKCGSKWDDAAAECCEGLVCAGKYCAEVPEEGGDVCAVDGEKSLNCGSKKGKEFCCEGLVCHEDQYWRCVIEENKRCSGPDTLAKDCGSKWKYAAKSCCDGLACDPAGKFCRQQSGDALTCAVDGEKSLDCGSKLGKQSCCEGLVCHEDQYWRCVKPEYTTCSGPNTLAQECGSEWEDASEKCCEGLVCGDDKYCVKPASSS